ncbi:MAG: hypothetical protein JWO40_10 [Candidatus Doudnabacteria bacterium]|nr:hypothetical protein [Candidatus Doudnabacteria bacterium]
MFAKDVLLIDIETTGINPHTALPIQIAAVLLDKETLEEKSSYSTYIQQDLTDANPESMAINGIKPEQLQTAPSEKEVVDAIVEKFGFDVLLASWVEFLDRRLFQRMFLNSGYDPAKFDPHYLDLWPVAYVYLLKQGYNGSIRSEPMMQALGLSARGAHDALEDCRHAADALRKIMVEGLK